MKDILFIDIFKENKINVNLKSIFLAPCSLKLNEPKYKNIDKDLI